MSEMVTYLPISSPFIRFAGRYIDEAFGVAAGYNFFAFEAALVPFEVVACNVKSALREFSYIWLTSIGDYTLLERHRAGRRNYCYYYSALWV
jgi:Amino acid permease